MQRAKGCKELLAGGRTNAFDLLELGTMAEPTELAAMMRDGKTMCFISELGKEAMSRKWG